MLTTANDRRSSSSLLPRLLGLLLLALLWLLVSQARAVTPTPAPAGHAAAPAPVIQPIAVQ